MTPSFFVGAAAFASYLAATLLLLHLRGRSSAAAVVTLAAVVFFAGGLGLPLATGRAVLFWQYTAAYSFPTLVFLMAFGAIYKSVSFRMLDYLLEQPGRTASYDSLMRQYVAEESFKHRLEVILQAGFASRSADGFALTAKGRAIATVVRWLHALFAIEKSG